MQHFNVLNGFSEHFDTTTIAWVVYAFVRCDVCGVVETDAMLFKTQEPTTEVLTEWFLRPNWAKRRSSVLPCVDRLAELGKPWNASLITLANDVCPACQNEISLVRATHKRLQDFRREMFLLEWNADPDAPTEDYIDKMSSVFLQPNT